MKALVLRLDAPLMSFGSTIVDQYGYIDRFPGTSMLTGLIANAMGWHHGDFGRLESLQARLKFAARWDVPPRKAIDYHTVDLGQRKMASPGWTTRGTPEHRDGGSAKTGIHQRFRHYWTDGLMTIALALTGNDEPSLDRVKQAIERPARPLFLGRKTCLPARPLLDPCDPVVECKSVLDALRRVPLWNRYGEIDLHTRDCEACWPADIDTPEVMNVRRVYDARDWPNQIAAGSRLRAEGMLKGESQ